MEKSLAAEDTASGRRGQSGDRAARTRNNSKTAFAPDLFRLGDHAAGDARWSTAAGAASHGVNDNGGSAVAEDGVFVRAESYIWRHRAGVGLAVSRDDQRKIRNIAGGAPILMPSCAWPPPKCGPADLKSGASHLAT